MKGFRIRSHLMTTIQLYLYFLSSGVKKKKLVPWSPMISFASDDKIIVSLLSSANGPLV